MENQEANSPVEDKDDNDNVIFTPGENEITLSHILSYLPYESLKNARIVGNMWNVEGTKILRKKSMVNFDFDFYSDYDQPEDTTRFSRYDDEMKSFLKPIFSWSMEIPGFWGDVDSEAEEPEDVDRSPPRPNGSIMKRYQCKQKYEADLEWFLNKRGQNIVSELKLKSTYVITEFGSEMQLKILNKLQTSLKSLELSGNCVFRRDDDDDSFMPFPFERIVFPNLEKFKFIMSWINPVTEDRSRGVAWIKTLLPAIMNVKEIELISYCPISTIPICLEMKNLPHLESVLLDLRQTYPPILEHLLTIQRPLKKLQLNLGDLTTQKIGLFECLIGKHSKFLEHLSFSFAGIGEQDHLKMIFPSVMPKLTRLNIGFKPTVSKSNFLLRFSFPQSGEEDDDDDEENDVIDYERNFPSLQSLTLWHGHHYQYRTENILNFKEYDQFFQEFIPSPTIKQGMICKTLQYLDIPFEIPVPPPPPPRKLLDIILFPLRNLIPFDFDDDDLSQSQQPDKKPTSLNETKPIEISRAVEIANMFPNVVNNWLNEAREWQNQLQDDENSDGEDDNGENQ